MPKKGEKFICGGREFWCIGTIKETDKILMHSGGVTVQIPNRGFDLAFQKIDELVLDHQYTAKDSFPGIEAGQTYRVTKIDGEQIELDHSIPTPYPLFVRLF